MIGYKANCGEIQEPLGEAETYFEKAESSSAQKTTRKFLRWGELSNLVPSAEPNSVKIKR